MIDSLSNSKYKCNLGGIVMDLKKEHMDTIRDEAKGVKSSEPSLIPTDNIISLDVISELLQSCHLNHAACQLKLGDMKSVIQSTSMVLELDTKNIKGLFRRGQAYLNLNKLDQAAIDFKKLENLVQKNTPEYEQLKLQLKFLDEKFKNHYEKEKEMFAGKLFK
jgi:tetratricopeptide (TPR) repeat protein